VSDEHYDVIVAGLGATGSATAWRLARAGLKVLGLDQYSPPHSHGSSHGGSRIIRELAFEHPRYVPMARAAWPLWRELEAATGARLVQLTGALYLGQPQSGLVAGSRRGATEHGVACEEFAAGALRRRWPVLAPEEGMVGLLESNAGVLDPEACVAAALRAAAQGGARLSHGESVVEWAAEAGGVRVRTDRGSYGATHLVLAAGPWMPELARLPGVRLEVERVVQHWFRPARDAGLLGPDRLPVWLWEDAEGLVFYGFPLLEGAVKCAIHHRGEIAPIDRVNRTVSPGEIERARALLARFIPAAAGEYDRSAVCVYTNTGSGDFIIDRHPEAESVVVLSPCNGIGFKFAPLIGELATRLVRGEEPGFALDAFRVPGDRGTGG
jgi:sarcosine oxidase